MFDCYKEKLVVGRGATAIYLVLKTKYKNADVIVPANICYAAVYPILYSCNNPVFCDVSLKSGNMTLESLKNAVTVNTKAVIAPHMYGNPISEIGAIATFCKDNNILLIEDCASAMGASINNRQVGSFGDYTVFSTGYSKTVDLGNGGILMSDNGLENERNLYLSLEYFNSDTAVANSLFSKMYRSFRNSKADIRETDFYNFCHQNLYSNFIYRLNDELASKLLDEVSLNLEKVIEIRRNASAYYDSLIDYDDIIKPYILSEGAVPWRKNILVKKEYRDGFISELLKQDVPVSDWYPVVSGIFDDYSYYENADKMEKCILNFPLTVGVKQIEEICYHIGKIKKGFFNGIS